MLWNEFAEAIFDFYIKKKPKYKDRFSGESKTFEEIFGRYFSNVEKSLRESLVSLVIDDGAYKLK